MTKITNQNQWVRKVRINNLQDCLKIFLPKIKVKFDIDLCTHDNGSNNDLANLGEDISLELQSPADVHLLELVEALNRRNSMLIFLKNLGQTWPLFPLFSSFYHSNINFHNINWKSVDDVLGIWTQGCRMVGTDETKELWRPPLHVTNFILNLNIVWTGFVSKFSKGNPTSFQTSSVLIIRWSRIFIWSGPVEDS